MREARKRPPYSGRIGIGGTHPTPEPAEGTAANGRPRESVWAYPRPPRIEPVDRRTRVRLAGTTIVDTQRAVRILETAGAPTIYVPSADVLEGALRPAAGSSFCEWKGAAQYFDVIAGDVVAERAAWGYENPSPSFAPIAGFVSFYPALVECLLNEERVEPQPGGFYGGWVTAEIMGPIKGAPGSGSW